MLLLLGVADRQKSFRVRRDVFKLLEFQTNCCFTLQTAFLFLFFFLEVAADISPEKAGSVASLQTCVGDANTRSERRIHGQDDGPVG